MNAPGLDNLGRALIIAGAVLLGIGLLVRYGGSIGLGRLPGDILIRRGNFIVYFPLVTTLLISLIVSLILALLRRH